MISLTKPESETTTQRNNHQQGLKTLIHTPSFLFTSPQQGEAEGKRLKLEPRSSGKMKARITWTTLHQSVDTLKPCYHLQRETQTTRRRVKKQKLRAKTGEETHRLLFKSATFQPRDPRCPAWSCLEYLCNVLDVVLSFSGDLYRVQGLEAKKPLLEIR